MLWLRCDDKRNDAAYRAYEEHPIDEPDAGGDLRLAGAVHRIRRPRPDRFVDDLANTRPTTGVKVALLRARADLAAGVPCLTWRATELAPRSRGGAAAVSGWSELRRITEPSTAREWWEMGALTPYCGRSLMEVDHGYLPSGI